MATNEAKLISAVCKNKDFHVVIGEEPELFGPYGDMFEFMKNYYIQHKAVPEASLLVEKFDDFEEAETSAPTKYYLESLKSEFIKYRTQEIMMKAAKALENNSPPEVLGKLQTSLAKLSRYTLSARDLDVTDLDAAEEHFVRMREGAEQNGGTPGISTGFKSIDSAYTTGMAGGHSIILMGYMSRGKSMFADLLAVKAWEQGFKPMIVSLEMSPEEQMERIYALMGSGRFKISDLARGDVGIDDLRSWGKKKFSRGNKLVVVSNEGALDVTPNTIQGKIDTHRPDLVIVDYLQLMNDNAKTTAMTPRMLNLSREIKLMAVSSNIPVISITAVTDDDNDQRDAPPVLRQVAWSKGIEYDANLAMAIHRHDNSNMVEVAGRKNRHGDLFNFYFDVDFDKGIWEEHF